MPLTRFDLVLPQFRLWALSEGCNRENGKGYACSPETVRRCIRRVRRFRNLGLDMFRPSQEWIYSYVDGQLSARRKKNKSLRLEMEDLGRWFAFLESTGKTVPVDLPHFRKEPDPEPWIPSESDIDTMLGACRSMRTRTMILVLAYGGLRIGELVRLTVQDIRPEGLQVHSEKKEADRLAALPEKVMNELKSWLEIRPSVNSRSLFTTSGGPMTVAYARKTLTDVAKKAGFHEFSPHSLRHYCATFLLSHGVDVHLVQKQLGHSSISTTERYLHMTRTRRVQEIRKVYDEFFRVQEVVICAV